MEDEDGDCVQERRKCPCFDDDDYGYDGDDFDDDGMNFHPALIVSLTAALKLFLAFSSWTNWYMNDDDEEEEDIESDDKDDKNDRRNSGGTLRQKLNLIDT